MPFFVAKINGEGKPGFYLTIEPRFFNDLKRGFNKIVKGSTITSVLGDVKENQAK